MRTAGKGLNSMRTRRDHQGPGKHRGLIVTNKTMNRDYTKELPEEAEARRRALIDIEDNEGVIEKVVGNTAYIKPYQKNLKWFFERDGVKEEVPVERWAWGVVYKDGREFHQYDREGVFHQLKEIDQENVKLWVLYKVGEENKRIDILLPEGAKLIHKYKRYVFNAAALNGGDKSQEKQVTVYVIGYKTEGASHYNYVLPDDRIVQANADIPLSEYNIE